MFARKRGIALKGMKKRRNEGAKSREKKREDMGGPERAREGK